jgi:hypothetical protein
VAAIANLGEHHAQQIAHRVHGIHLLLIQGNVERGFDREDELDRQDGVEAGDVSEYLGLSLGQGGLAEDVSGRGLDGGDYFGFGHAGVRMGGT